MKLRNEITGDVVEVPPPTRTGHSVVRLNGQVVESVLYSDDFGGTVTNSKGRVFTATEWSDYVVEQLRIGAWKVIN